MKTIPSAVRIKTHIAIRTIQMFATVGVSPSTKWFMHHEIKNIAVGIRPKRHKTNTLS